MAEYIVRSIACFLILYLAYIVFFRNSRNYHINRVVLLLSVLFSLIVPMLNMAGEHTILLLRVPPGNYLSASDPAIAPTATDPVSISSLIPAVYTIISLALLIRFIIHLSLLLRKGYRAEKVNYKGNILALIPEKVNPFTFFHTIFISRENYNEPDEELILHELAHKKQLHSIDVVLMELILVFCWFNPFVYLFKKLIKANHEYLADDYVLQSGVSISYYSDKIIHHTFKNRTAGLVSGFNHFFIRKRLILLSKFNEGGGFAYQLLLLMPVSTVLFFATAFKPGVVNGVFYADAISWSGDKEIRMEGKLKVQFGRNDFTGEGSFSGFDKGIILVVDGKKLALNQSVNISGKRCELIILTKEQAALKYGSDGSLGAVEVYTSR